MRPAILLTFACLSMAANVQGQILDARVQIGASTRSSGFSEVKHLPISVSITELSDQDQLLNTPFEYEVQLTNVGSNAITIPWSVDAGLNEVPSNSLIEASIVLSLANAVGEHYSLGATDTYGRMDEPSTVYSLQPGASVRIRLTSKWALSRINPVAYLGSQAASVAVNATYRLITHSTLWSTTPSTSKLVTLVVP